MKIQFKSFIPYIDLTSNKYREIQITNLLDYETDIFNNAIKLTEKRIIEKIDRNNRKTISLDKKITKNTSHNINKSAEENYDVQLEILELSNSTYYLNEQYRVFAEMKIIYLYKCLEIKILKLLEIGFPDLKPIDNFNIDLVTIQFGKKGIDLKNVIGFTEFDELRLVNNFIKHSGDIKKLSKIKGFGTLTQLNGLVINLFLVRIKDIIDHFYEKLALLVIEKLK